MEGQEVRLQGHSLISQAHPVGVLMQFPVNPAVLPSGHMMVAISGWIPQLEAEQLLQISTPVESK